MNGSWWPVEQPLNDVDKSDQQQTAKKCEAVHNPWDELYTSNQFSQMF